MKYDQVIEKLRSKDDEEILNNIIQEVEGNKEVRAHSPDVDSLGVNDTQYQIPPDQGGRMKYQTSHGEIAVPFIRIANMLNAGLSPIIGIFGKEQMGKSETALFMNHFLHNEMNIFAGEFNPKNQVVYEVVPFLVLLRNSVRTSIMFDEAGETLNKNDYNSKMNRAVAGSLRTQSKRQICYFFVTPEFSELDPRIREKLDIEIEMVSTGTAKVTLYERIHSRKAENKKRNYNFDPISGTWDVPRAPKNLRKKYDELDSGFKGRYLDELLMDAIEERLEDNDMVEF